MSSENKTTGRLGEAVAPRSISDEEILRAVRNVKFGSVEITIHDAKVVQASESDRPDEKVIFTRVQVAI